MNELQSGENIKIEDLYTWGKTHGLKKKKCRELIKGLIPEQHENLTYISTEKLIGSFWGYIGTWSGEEETWKPSMTVDQLIWRYAPEWATKLRFGEITERFIWSSVDELQYFGEPKQGNSLVYTKILSTKPTVTKSLFEGDSFFSHTASNPFTWGWVDPIKPFKPVVGEQCEVYNHRDKSWLCVTPQYIGRTVIVLSRGLQEYSRKLSTVKLRKPQPRGLFDEAIKQAVTHQQRKIFESMCSKSVFGAFPIAHKIINISTPNVRGDSFVDEVMKNTFAVTIPKQSTATKSDLTKAEEELRALIAALSNDKRLL